MGYPMYAHTLIQDPNNCRFENVENETTQHNIYILTKLHIQFTVSTSTKRNYFQPYLQCIHRYMQNTVSGTPKTKLFVADINIKCNGVHCMRAAGENFWKYIAYAYLHRHTRITWNRTSYAYVCWKHHVYTGNMFCVRKATMCNYLYRVSAEA